MSGRITETTISDLKNHTQEIFDLVHRTGQPVAVTVNGKPEIVLLDAAFSIFRPVPRPKAYLSRGYEWQVNLLWFRFRPEDKPKHHAGRCHS